MHALFYWLGWDENATKATNVASKNRLVIVSYCGFTIFPTSIALTVHAIFVVATTLHATISLLLVLSTPRSQTLKHIYPWKFANDENSNIA
jgi:hypothetical protein